MKNPKVNLSTSLELTLAIDLEEFCERECIPKNYVIATALRKFLKENE